MITIANLTTYASGVSATSFSTSAFTPTGNKPVLASVTTRVAAADPNTPTLSGNGLTWVMVGSSQNYDNSGSQKRVTLFRAMGASPSNGALTADFAGQTQTDCVIVVDQLTNADISGTNGSGAIVQTANASDTTGSTNTLSATLAGFTTLANATYGVCAIGNTGTFTPGGGFTTVGTNGTSNITLATEFKDSNDTGVDFSFSANGELGLIAVELKHVVSDISTLVDNFNDNSLDTTLYGSFGSTVSETNQQLELLNGANYTSYLGIFTIRRYFLTSSAVTIKLVNAGNQSLTSLQALIQLELDSNNQVYYLVEGNTLKAVKKVSGAVSDVNTVAYNSTTMAYLKISESGGTISWDYSSNGQSWTNLTTLSNPFAVTSLQVNILAGTYSNEASSTTVIWDNLNVIPSATAMTATRLLLGV